MNQQLEFQFSTDRPAFTRYGLEPYRREWRTAFAALGGCDRAGWMQDLCFYFDLQWNVETGEVGPVRYFIAPLILRGVFDCREIHAPDRWTVPQVYRAVQMFSRFKLHGPTPRNWRRMPYRTADISVKGIKAAIRAQKKFCYEDRTARCGRIHYAKGCRIEPARVVWE